MKRAKLIQLLNDTLKIVSKNNQVKYTIQTNPKNYKKYVNDSFDFIKHPFYHHLKK
jgi:hypothetical protein